VLFLRGLSDDGPYQQKRTKQSGTPAETYVSAGWRNECRESLSQHDAVSVSRILMLLVTLARTASPHHSTGGNATRSRVARRERESCSRHYYRAFVFGEPPGKPPTPTPHTLFFFVRISAHEEGEGEPAIGNNAVNTCERNTKKRYRCNWPCLSISRLQHYFPLGS
jgi:hypothetical protein